MSQSLIKSPQSILQISIAIITHLNHPAPKCQLIKSTVSYFFKVILLKTHLAHCHIIDPYAWLQNHAVHATQSDGSDIIVGYLSVEKPVSSPSDANAQITAFEWGMGPVRVSTISFRIFFL